MTAAFCPGACRGGLSQFPRPAPLDVVFAPSAGSRDKVSYTRSRGRASKIALGARGVARNGNPALLAESGLILG